MLISFLLEESDMGYFRTFSASNDLLMTFSFPSYPLLSMSGIW